MRNIILSIALTALTFSGALNYAFLTGKFSTAEDQRDYVTKLASK